MDINPSDYYNDPNFDYGAYGEGAENSTDADNSTEGAPQRLLANEWENRDWSKEG